MTRPSRRARKLANLRCNACEHQFRDRAWAVSVETADRGTLNWVPADGGTVGNKCPQCGSERISFRWPEPLV
jgi:hypothetical protein